MKGSPILAMRATRDDLANLAVITAALRATGHPAANLTATLRHALSFTAAATRPAAEPAERS